jgi:hypothetical protein
MIKATAEHPKCIANKVELSNGSWFVVQEPCRSAREPLGLPILALSLSIT